MELLKSSYLLLWGIIKRLYYVAPSILLDPFDFAGRLFKVNYDPPQWMAWFLFCVGLALAILLTYHELRVSVGCKNDKRSIRQSLSNYLNEGSKIKKKCSNQAIGAPTQEAESWAKNVDEFLASKLGDDYVETFYSNDGLPISLTTLHSVEHQQVESFMRARLTRINEFLKELRG